MEIRKKKKINTLLDIILMVAIVISCAVVIFKLSTIKVVISGNSMNPSIINGYTGYMFKTTDNTKLKRFEIVAYERNDNDFLIKRILGLPNETVTIDTNKLIVNGQEITQDFEFIHDQTRLNKTYTLGDNEYLIVGDNRRDTIAPVVANIEYIVAHGGFLNGTCKAYDGAVCTISSLNKEWVWLDGKH